MIDDLDPTGFPELDKHHEVLRFQLFHAAHQHANIQMGMFSCTGARISCTGEAVSASEPFAGTFAHLGLLDLVA